VLFARLIVHMGRDAVEHALEPGLERVLVRSLVGRGLEQGEQQGEVGGASASVWTSWVVNLLVAEWWFGRRRGVSPAGRGAPSIP
jgi:hypothetical protein